MSIATTTIGPKDNGRRMNLDDFDQAEGQEGFHFELSRGIVTVTDVPRPSHGAVVAALRDMLVIYKKDHPERIYNIFGGQECKILLADLQSERHPDIAVYTNPPYTDHADVWAGWVPEIVVEVVSRDSVHRDYEQKPDEYFAFGVREYWIADPLEKRLTVLKRHGGKWAESVLTSGETYACPILPGLKIDVAEVLASARIGPA